MLPCVVSFPRVWLLSSVRMPALQMLSTPPLPIMKPFYSSLLHVWLFLLLLCGTMAAPRMHAQTTTPRSTDDPLTAAIAKIATKDYDQAKAILNKAIAASPNNPELYMQRGIAKMRSGEDEDAMLDFTNAVRLQARSPLAYQYRGTLKALQGDYQGALYDFNKAINADPENANLYNLRGEVSAKMGMTSQATADGDEAKKHTRQDGNATLNELRPVAETVNKNRANTNTPAERRKAAVAQVAQPVASKVIDRSATQSEDKAVVMPPKNTIPAATTATVAPAAVPQVRVVSPPATATSSSVARNTSPTTKVVPASAVAETTTKTTLKTPAKTSTSPSTATATPKAGELVASVEVMPVEEAKQRGYTVEETAPKAATSKPAPALPTGSDVQKPTVDNKKAVPQAIAKPEPKDAANAANSGADNGQATTSYGSSNKDAVKRRLFQEAAKKAKVENYRGAANDLDSLIGIDPEFTIAHFNRGIARSALEDYDGALTDFNAVIAKKPTMMEAYFNRGNLYSDMGRYNDAIVDYTKAIELRAGYVPAFINRALAKKAIDKDFCTDLQEAKALGSTKAKAYIERLCDSADKPDATKNAKANPNASNAK